MAAPYTVGGPTIPDSLHPVMQGVASRLAMMQGQSQAQSAFAPVVSQIQGQALSPDALAPVPADISDPKAALAIALSNLGAALTAGAGVHGLATDPNGAFNTILGRRSEIRAVQRSNAATKGAFETGKQNSLNEIAAKQAETGVSLGQGEINRREGAKQFDAQMEYNKLKDSIDAGLRKREQDIQLEIAKMNTGADANAAIQKALAQAQAEGLGRDMSIVLGGLAAEAVHGNGTFQVYLPVRDMNPVDARSAPTDPTTKLPMRAFTTRAGVEAYMDGMISGLSPLLQPTVKKMWLESSAPVWAQIEQRAKATETEGMKRAEAAAKVRAQGQAAGKKITSAARGVPASGGAPGSVAQ